MTLSDEVMELGRRPLPRHAFVRTYRRGRPVGQVRRAVAVTLFLLVLAPLVAWNFWYWWPASG